MEIWWTVSSCGNAAATNFLENCDESDHILSCITSTGRCFIISEMKRMSVSLEWSGLSVAITFEKWSLLWNKLNLILIPMCRLDFVLIAAGVVFSEIHLWHHNIRVTALNYFFIRTMLLFLCDLDMVVKKKLWKLLCNLMADLQYFQFPQFWQACLSRSPMHSRLFPAPLFWNRSEAMTRKIILHHGTRHTCYFSSCHLMKLRQLQMEIRWNTAVYHVHRETRARPV